MSGLTKDTDEILKDTNSLLKLIGGSKKKEDFPLEKDPGLPSISPAVEEETAEAGDFSALLKKTGCDKKRDT